MGYGLVLSGGGAKGSFEIGVWKALRELSIEIDAVVGTSVGALNGAVIAQNDFDKAMHFWSNLSMDQVFSFNKDITDKYVNDWSKQSWNQFTASFKSYVFEGGLDITPLKEFLHRNIDEEKVRNSPIRFGLVTYSLTDFEPLELMIEDIPQGQLVDYLLASASFPTFKRHEIDGKTFIDGAVYNNMPMDLLINQGYQKLITVELPSLGRKRTPDKSKDLEIVHIKNSEHLGLILEFDPQRMQKNITIGYLDALKKFGAVEGKHYYLKTKDNRIYHRFKSRVGSPCHFASTTLHNNVHVLLGLESFTDEDEITQCIRQNIGYTMFKKEEIPLAMLEITAKTLDIDRLQIYTADQLIKKIFKTANALIDDQLKLLKSDMSILEAFRAKEEFEIDPATSLKFLAYYIYFLSLSAKQDAKNKQLLTKLISRFTPDITLSILTLLYLTEKQPVR
ncbi:MAG TPA: patatin [Eubacteriaceae bacterium]|nr:patatin [Eubacteriaceae bacterium]